jgi:hypothetical protein
LSQPKQTERRFGVNLSISLFLNSGERCAYTCSIILGLLGDAEGLVGELFRDQLHADGASAGENADTTGFDDREGAGKRFAAIPHEV